MKNAELKEKCVISLILVLVMGFILFYTYWDEGSTAASNQYEGIIRLHVIANSNTKEDQNLKLKVRDNILKEVNGLEQKLNIENSRSYLEKNLDQMEKIASKTVKENGKSYPVKAELGVRWIPEKTYGDMTFPAGNYEALSITLGKGEGENWWCVLFPPLCLIDESQDTVEGMQMNSEETIKLKSRLKEILEHRKTEDKRNAQAV